ncbi:flavodoxin FldB [Litoribrevibacter euphylliae]|uniref:Flavodoxin n=1 Tax=Litoribrevibacter euphylliae TaxID=1834034 RepID=A0ABV7HDD5_9GAMM
MATIGLFYGSSLGNTETVAEKIRDLLDEHTVEMHDIAAVTKDSFSEYDYLILGIPTWDYGQIQSDWDEFWQELGTVDFSGKLVALFGLGDQFGYADYFLDAMGMLHDVVIDQGGAVMGYWPVDGYEFEASKALTEDGKEFVGLAIDEDQQPELTDERVAQWVAQVEDEFDF